MRSLSATTKSSLHLLQLEKACTKSKEDPCGKNKKDI